MSVCFKIDLCMAPSVAFSEDSHHFRNIWSSSIHHFAANGGPIESICMWTYKLPKAPVSPFPKKSWHSVLPKFWAPSSRTYQSCYISIPENALMFVSSIWAKYYELSSLVMLVYDIVLTSHREIDTIWKRKFSGLTLLWILVSDFKLRWWDNPNLDTESMGFSSSSLLEHNP